MKKFLLFIFGACWLVMGIVGFLFGTKPLNATICLVLGIISLFIVFSKRDAPAAVPSSPVPSKSGKKQPPEVRFATCHSATFDVAGVSFENDDGSERQKILRKIHFGDAPFDSENIVTLLPYEYDGALAYYIQVNGYTVGNVPKEFVDVVEWLCRKPYHITYFKTHGGGNHRFGAELHIEQD